MENKKPQKKVKLSDDFIIYFEKGEIILYNCISKKKFTINELIVTIEPV